MSVETNPHNYTNMNLIFSQFVAANFFKKESRSPRGFLPRPLLRAGESEFRTPPPFPQKNEAGCGQEFRSKKVRANAKITPPKNIPLCWDVFWWTVRGSNPPPLQCHCSALPNELTALVNCEQYILNQKPRQVCRGFEMRF